MLPANELARRYPAVLNLRTEPLQWAKGAARNGLPESVWAPVVADVRAAAGASPSPDPEQGPRSPAAAPAAEASGGAASTSPAWDPDPRSLSPVSASGAAGEHTVSSSNGGHVEGCGGAGSHAIAHDQHSAPAGAQPVAPPRPAGGADAAAVEGPVVHRRRLHFPRAAERGKLFDEHGRAKS